MEQQLLLPAPGWWDEHQESTADFKAKDAASKLIEAFTSILYGNYYMFPNTPGHLPVKILDLKIEVRVVGGMPVPHPSLFILMKVECCRVLRHVSFTVDVSTYLCSTQEDIRLIADTLLRRVARQVSLSRSIDLSEGVDDDLPRCPICASRSFWHVDHVYRKCDRCGYRGNVHNFFFRRKHESKIKPASLSRLVTGD